MHQRVSLLWAWVLLVPCLGHPNHQLDLTYTTSAKDWATESLPLGNGYFGALVLPGVAEDRLRLCDPLLRDAEGKQKAMVDLVIATGHDPSQARTYLHRLDLQTASVEVSYRDGRIRHRREYFASEPDRVLVGKWRAIRKGALNLTLAWDCLYPEATITFDPETNRFSVSGEGFEATLELRLKSGEVVLTEDQKVLVKNSDQVAMILTVSQGEAFRAASHLDSLKHDDAIAIYQRHLPLYQDRFHAMYLTLEGGAKSQLETGKRRRLYAEKPEEDPGFEELLFQYGRYLFIASTRATKEGHQPHARGLWWFPEKGDFLDNGSDARLQALIQAGAGPSQLYGGETVSPFEVDSRVGHLPWLTETDTAMGNVSRFFVKAVGGDAEAAYAEFRQFLQSYLTNNLLVTDQNLAANMIVIRSVCDLFAREEAGVLHLGDRLPKHWSDGSVVGMRTPSYELAYVWQGGGFFEGYLTRLADGEAVLKSTIPLRLDRPGDENVFILTPDDSGLVRFPMEADKTMRLRLVGDKVQ